MWQLVRFGKRRFLQGLADQLDDQHRVRAGQSLAALLHVGEVLSPSSASFFAAAMSDGDTAISGESHVNLGEVVSVGVAVLRNPWWLGRKFQAIEDALAAHGKALEKLPCVQAKVNRCEEGTEARECE